MSSIQDSAMHIWANGEDITQDRLEQNRKVFQTAINDNQSQISAQYTNAQIDAKVNTAASTTKVVQAGTVFPTTGLVDGQEFYRDDLHIMYIYDAALNKWVDRGSIASQGFRNLLDPSKQSFTRASNATRKDLTPVPFNVLRTEQGRFGQGAFIEEATTNLPYNTDFETITGTATVFSDNMTAGTTADPAWTVQSGSFTWSTSGATSGAAGANITAGNSSWKPLTGSNGTVLSLTMQATVTTPATLTTSQDGTLFLYQNSSNWYAALINNNSFVLNKCVNGTVTSLTSISQTVTASTTYTITLASTPSGGLTAKLYSGTGTGGTLLQTLTATDTSLTGGFLIGVGGDTGVVIKNAQVTAPFADGWFIAGDQRVAWALTSTNPISGSYSVSAVGVANSVSGWVGNTTSITVTAGSTYTVSTYSNGSGIGSGKALVAINATGLSQQQFVFPTGTYATQRGATTFTIPSNATSPTIGVNLELSDVGTAVFDCIQVENKAYATTYVRNDSTSASATRNADLLSYTLSNPLPSRYFGALVWTPSYSSSIYPTNVDHALVMTGNQSNAWRHIVRYNSTDGFNFFKSPDGGTTKYNPTAINPTFNVGDRVFVAWLDDPTSGNMTLWVGVNNGTLQQTTLSNSTQITDVSKVAVGCEFNAGSEANGTIDYPIITDIIPTADQVQALYQASDWGGDRNYPGVQFLQGDVQVKGSSPLIVSGNGIPANSNRPYGSIGQWYTGVGIMSTKNFGDTNPNFIVETNDGTPIIQSKNDGSLQGKFGSLLQALSGGYKVQSGQLTISVATAGTLASTTLTFPTAFSSAPYVYAVLRSTPATNGYVVVGSDTETTTNVRIWANAFVAETVYINWIAIGS